VRDIRNSGRHLLDLINEILDLSRVEAGRMDLDLAAVSLADVLEHGVAMVRERFGGRLTYAAIPFEQVDWTIFDIISLELIRSAEVADHFAEGVRKLVAAGKPAAITGFGTAAYRGAGDRGGRIMEIIQYDEETGVPVRLDGEYVRDEAGQATYLSELLEIFDSEGVDSTFVFLFALDGFPHRPDGDPRDDLDRASPSIVKILEGRNGSTYPDLAWEPKAAFTTVAECYGRIAAASSRP
jgi:hypothetical protein